MILSARGGERSRDLDVVDERLQALHLPVWPPRDAELPALLLQTGDTHVELSRRLLDRNAEMPRHLLEGQFLLL